MRFGKMCLFDEILFTKLTIQIIVGSDAFQLTSAQKNLVNNPKLGQTIYTRASLRIFTPIQCQTRGFRTKNDEDTFQKIEIVNLSLITNFKRTVTNQRSIVLQTRSLSHKLLNDQTNLPVINLFHDNPDIFPRLHILCLNFNLCNRFT